MNTKTRQAKFSKNQLSILAGFALSLTMGMPTLHTLIGSASPLPAWGEATLSSHRNTSVQPATSLPKQINQEQCQLDSTGATVDLVNLCMGYITSANGTQPIANSCCAKFLQDYHG
jgi:hypothetical protein